MQEEEKTPQAKTFAMGLEFLELNHKHDNWFLQVETFDPHEPYFLPDKYKQLYGFDFSKSTRDWPNYTFAEEAPDHVKLFDHFRYLNAALISMCDAYLGKVLDAMDRFDLWKDTMLIVNTDHGFLLGEHDWWGKCRMPFYNEIANTPFFIWDPREKVAGERRSSLIQTIDIAPTLLEFFNLPVPQDMQGRPLRQVVASDTPVRLAALFGNHGGHVNVTDGKHVYMRAPANPRNFPINEYTYMPAHMRNPFSVEAMRDKLTGLAEPFSFTKGCRTMKIDASGGDNQWCAAHSFGNLLFNIENDPRQENPLDNPELEKTMIQHLVREMKASDAPKEQFQRLGLEG